jgi:hypothetical protein
MRAPARVSLMQSAGVPSTAIELIPYKILVLASLIALLAPMGLAVGHELIVRRISNPDQLTQESLLPVLGEVSHFPMRQVTSSHQSLPAPRQRELYIFAESIDSLRTNLSLTENLGAPDEKNTAFGAFVDVGVHQDGLVHVSELADRFVSDPNQVVRVGEKVTVRVLSVDVARRRIALSMRSGTSADRGGGEAGKRASSATDRPGGDRPRSGSDARKPPAPQPRQPGTDETDIAPNGMRIRRR